MPGWSQYVGFLEWSLNNIADVALNGAVAIIIFTIIIKTILLPLTMKSIRSAKAMQELQPKIKELQKKHGKNREELSKQTMQLYAQYQVNPLAGCLPLVIQIPIFFGVYRAILNLSERGEGHFADTFLWLNSLAESDPYKILPILAGLFQFVQTRMSRPADAPKVTDQQQQIMNTLLNVMPIMVVLFGWTFASGAVIYWVTQSIYSVIQQWFVGGWGSLIKWAPWLPELPEHRRLGYRAPRNLDDIVVEMDSRGRPRQSGMMGRIQARLEEAQNQAETQRAARDGGESTANTTGAKTQPATANGATATATATRPVAGKNRKKRKGSSYQQRVDAATRNVATSSAADGDVIEVEGAVTADAAETSPTKNATGRGSYESRVASATRRGPRSSWKENGTSGKPSLASVDEQAGE